MLEKPPEANTVLTIGSGIRQAEPFEEETDLSEADACVPVTSRTILPKSVRLVARYTGIIEEIEEDCILTILTDADGQEYSSNFKTNEFLPGCSLVTGMSFDSYLLRLQNEREVWVNHPRPSANPEAAEVRARLAQLDAVFGDSGY